MLKLKFRFWQPGLDGEYFPMWDVINSPAPHISPDGSTVSLNQWKLLYNIQCDKTTNRLGENK